MSKRTLDTYVDSRAVIPNAEIVVKLAKALDTTVEYLVTGENLNISNKSLDLDFSSFEKQKNLFKDLEKLSPNLQYSIEVMIHTLVKLENK
ncbi:MAG TPA: hypothetical protein DDW20_00675 [Firmicutes bacterium]|nr:hypothetical protein [Bacillota bacterium]